MNKTLRTASRQVKRAGRKLSATLLTAAAVGAMIPYRVEKETNETTGDNGFAVTSLLFRTSISPKTEDSIRDKTLLTVKLRPMDEIRADVKRFEALRKPKEPVVAEDPFPLTEKEEKTLEKARKKARKTVKKIEKRRIKRAIKAAKAGKTA
ncbi:MAG: hypothetical protein J6B77_05165 [Clostridia bacterium]|nr:hypothetical protein [Clostridia bacterium]